MAETPKEIITSDDILGKDAIDLEGEFLGIVMKLHIDKEIKKLVGITVDQGFMKPDLFVGLDCIERFGVDAVFLNRIPFEKYIGLKVYDYDGSFIGIVADITELNGKVESIFIGSRIIDSVSSSRLKNIRINARFISEIGASVFLKKGITFEKKRDEIENST